MGLPRFRRALQNAPKSDVPEVYAGALHCLLPTLSYLEDRNGGGCLNYPSRPRGARQNGRKGGFFVADLRYQQG
jgi:hypothetical protein